MSVTGWSVRLDRFGKEWYRETGSEEWFTWLALDGDDEPEMKVRVKGAPEWP